MPGSEVQTLTEVSKLAESTAWRGRRVDATGFIFLGARYYEPNGGRFLSADPMGHGASMSLYDYCNGDPVNSFDPDGRYGKDLNKNPYPHRVAQSPWLQDVIDWLFGPGSSLPEKLMVTPFGDVVRSLDQTSKSFKDKDYIIAILRSLETAGDVATSLGVRAPKNAPHGNTLDGRPATLYEKYDKDGNFQKHGITKHEDPSKRYTKNQIDGGEVRPVERGPRSEMAKKERERVETNPGPDNKEPWARKRAGQSND